MLYLDMRVIMKKRTLTALILSALAAGQLISLSAHAATKQLNVWEDIKSPLVSRTPSKTLSKSTTLK
jgi:hypothetical protein